MSDHPLDPSTLLKGNENRLTLRATLKPVSGLDRFQPAGFPEIGHVIYDAPRPDNSTQKVCIVDSAASMANHLETVCLASERSLELSDELEGIPYVGCYTDRGWPKVKSEDIGPKSLVVTTFSEGHRLASDYFLDGQVVENDKASDLKFMEKLREQFGIADLKQYSHPLPEQWWDVFTTIFFYDPNSLVHGVMFPKLGIKFPRILTAHMEAYDASRVRSSGVKFDQLQQTTSGQPIFSVDEEVAGEIAATFVIDMALLRSLGRGDLGLNHNQKNFLLSFALWKIERILKSPFRYRSNCDLELDKLKIHSCDELIEVPAINIRKAIEEAQFRDQSLTKVYWESGKLFRLGMGSKLKGSDEESDSEEDQETGD